MQLGIHFVNFTFPGGPEQIGPILSDTAQAADDAGFAVFSLMDHWFQMEWRASATDPMLEGYTGLAFLAGRTREIKLGTLVTGVTYRHPGLLAKIVTTLDVVSGGRAQLGIGAAWYEREHRGLGVAFPPLSERFERLEEALQICLQMWSERRRALRGPALPTGRDDLQAGTGSAAHARRSWSVAVGSGRRSGSSPGTPTPAISSPRSRPLSPTSSTSCSATARRRVVIRPPSRRRSSASRTRWTMSTRFSPAWRSTRGLGVELVGAACRRGPIRHRGSGVGDRVVPKLAEIGPSR